MSNISRGTIIVNIEDREQVVSKIAGTQCFKIDIDSLEQNNISLQIISSPPWEIKGTMPEIQLKDLEKKADEYAVQIKAEAERKRIAYLEDIEKGKAFFEAEKPDWAKAVIVAYHETDDCDHMTDYYATKRGSIYILAWSKHTRDLFPEMRKAAAKFEHTKQLSKKPNTNRNGEPKTEQNKSYWHPHDEHREKYSMGGGYYLKSGTRYSTGWLIRKELLSYSSNDIYLAAAKGRLLA